MTVLGVYVGGVYNPVAGALGDVVGPGSAVDNAIVRFDGPTGKLIQSSGIGITDGNDFSLGGDTDFLIGANTAFRINTVPTPANFLEVESVSAGSDPALNALGSDTNINLLANPKGTGDFVTPRVTGVTTSGGKLTLASTKHPTKGLIEFGVSGTSVYDEATDKFGIGTNDPEFVASNDVFTMARDNSVSSIATYSFTAATGQAGALIIGRARGTQASPAIVQTGDRLGTFFARGYTGTQWLLPGRILFEVDSVPSATTMPTNMQFRAGASGAGTEIFRIDPAFDLTLSSVASLQWALNGVYNVPSTRKHGFLVAGAEQFRIENNVVTFVTGAGNEINANFSLSGVVAWRSGSTELMRMNSVPGIGFWGNAIAQPAAYTITNDTPDRVYDANATSVAELADVLATVIRDLISYGLFQ